MTSSIERLVDGLVDAYDPGRSVPLPHEVMSLGLDDARQVRAGVLRRLGDARGAVVTGYKVGLTSATAQAAMGARDPVYGELLDPWILRSPARITTGDLHCAVVEAELAFVFDEPLSPRASRDEIAAKSRVTAAMDVPDSRCAGWYPIADVVLVDLVADNAFAGRLVVGEATVPTASVDLVATRVELRVDGTPVDHGTGANVLGDPLAAVVWLSDQLADRRLAIKAGDVVSAGTMTAPVVGRPGLFEADFGELGTATLEISPS
ncbi:MAG TPA: fumarylacetoacetate hydrolase family protein [Iamia sp.]|nr:fumarylacetoacetate hydrolase family protein [Iamia sp.]